MSCKESVRGGNANWHSFTEDRCYSVYCNFTLYWYKHNCLKLYLAWKYINLSWFIVLLGCQSSCVIQACVHVYLSAWCHQSKRETYQILRYFQIQFSSNCYTDIIIVINKKKMYIQNKWKIEVSWLVVSYYILKYSITCLHYRLYILLLVTRPCSIRCYAYFCIVAPALF